MGDVIDFKSARERMNHEPEDVQAPCAGDEVELTYDPKPDSVGVTLSTTPEGLARLVVLAPAVDVGPAIRAAHDTLLANFGMAPGDERGLEAICRSMGQASVDAFVTTFVQQHFFGKAMVRTQIMPFLSPDYLTDELPVEGSDYRYELEVLMRPSYELTSYEPVHVKLPEKKEVTSKDVTSYLSGMSEELATWENDATRDAAEAGDHVTLNLDATANGREFKPLCGRHVPYIVGAGTVSPELDEALAGMKPRERRELSVSVPVPGESGELAYQMVQLKVQLDEIQRRVPATIDDVWVATNMPEAQTLLGLRSRVRTMLEREAERAYHDELMALCAEELATRLIGDPDEVYVDKMRDELISQFLEDLQRSGLDYQQFVSQPGFDVQAWEAGMTDEAYRALRRGFALDALADHLDIQLDQADIAKVVASMAPGHEEEALTAMVETGQMPKMCEIALRTRANEWLVEHVRGAGLKGSGALVIEGGAGEGRGSKSDRPDGPKLQLV